MIGKKNKDLYDEGEFWDEIEEDYSRRKILKKFLKLTFWLILLCLFSYLIYKLVNPTKVDVNNLPVVKADKSEYKVKPDDPGGMVIENMDKTIYGNLYGNNKVDIEEKIIPAPEKPIDRSSIGDKIQQDLAVENNKLDQPIKEEVTKSKTFIKNQPKEVYSNKKSVSKDQSNIKKAKYFRIQLASFNSLSSAELEWKKIKKKYKTLLKSYKVFFDKKESKNSKQLYKVQVGNFTNESSAKLLCKKLIQDGQNCIVLKN